MHDVLRTRVNDFAVKLANVNGTGSASANGLLMQAIFRMGIPVCGKNLFPSNIQGLPTWYEIRVNKEGYSARALDYSTMRSHRSGVLTTRRILGTPSFSSVRATTSFAAIMKSSMSSVARFFGCRTTSTTSP